MSNYPNLEKLEALASSLYTAEDFLLKQRIGDNSPKLEAFMFPQKWGSANLGFDDVFPYSEQSTVSAYTVVFHELNTETFVVFFGGELAYMVYDPSEIFYADLAKQKLQSVKLAKKLY